MVNFNIFGDHRKPIQRGGLPKKGGGGAWTVCQFRGAWQEKGGGAFKKGG